MSTKITTKVSVKGTKYKALLSKSQTEINSENLDHTVTEASIQLQSDILNAKKNISTKKKYLVEAKSSSSFNSASIISAQRAVALAERDLSDLEDMQVEMF